MIAHQYKIRLEKSKTEEIDFNLNDVSLHNTTIKKITKNEAKRVIVDYEWLKSLPTHTKYHYGLFFNINNKKYLGGVLVYSPEYSENLGTWDKFDFTGKILLLSRGVCLWWTPKNTASFFISKVNKIIAKETHYRIITATVDPEAGEIGTIYQSLNWYYLGVMSGNLNSNGSEKKRISFLINGVKRSSRWVRKCIGTMKIDEVKKHYPDVLVLKESRKRRYITFIDNKKNNKKYFNIIKNFIYKYPKRKESNIIGGKNSITSDSTKIKQSISHKGIKQDGDWIKKRIHKQGSVEALKYGKKKTDVEKKKLSNNSPKYWLGKNRSEETKQKISETKRQQKIKPTNRKSVIVIDLVTGAKQIFESTYECAEFFNLNQSTISRYCKEEKVKNNKKYIYK